MNVGHVNMLVPLAYEIAWTDLDCVPFNMRHYESPNRVQQLRLGVLPTNFCALPYQPERNFLFIQNNSAPGAGGAAPNLYVSWDGPAGVDGTFLLLFPGAALTLNQNVPPNSVFLAWGAFTAPATLAAVVHAGVGRRQ